VVNGYQTSGGQVFVKRQCMHCVTPACAASCLTKAFEKTKEGPVVWHEDKCMGCRYCMISCPFDVPKFEYDSPIPKVQKCKMCWEKLVKGEKPACVDFCPMEALTFGKRSELLETARGRIYQNPGKYISHIYGERELGGTGVLYISAVPFAELGFPTNFDDVPVPEETRDFLTAVPVVLTLFPAFLFGLRQATKQADNDTLSH
jgi:Fe-S-cluster-containing dehydrogenase component